MALFVIDFYYFFFFTWLLNDTVLSIGDVSVLDRTRESFNKIPIVFVMKDAVERKPVNAKSCGQSTLFP